MVVDVAKWSFIPFDKEIMVILNVSSVGIWVLGKIRLAVDQITSVKKTEPCVNLEGVPVNSLNKLEVGERWSNV